MALRTEAVYQKLLAEPKLSVRQRMRRSWPVGLVMGKLYLIFIVVDTLLLWILSLVMPARRMDKTPWLSVAQRSAINGAQSLREGSQVENKEKEAETEAEVGVFPQESAGASAHGRESSGRKRR